MTTRHPNQIQNPGNFIKYIILAFFLFMLFIILSRTTFVTIESGHEGVLFKRFGGGLDKEHVYGQGLHVIAPWNKLFIYDTRIQQGSEEMNALSKNGLNIMVDLSYLYKPVNGRIGYLHNNIGADYDDRIIKPEMRSATREVIGKYLPEELYSTKRESIQEEIFQATQSALLKRDIDLTAILIKGVELPKSLQDAIERKLKEEQSSLEYEYRLDRERQEAERRLIEAQAKADANRILSASLTDKILADKGIEATLELAKSNNSKIVLIGSGDNGLPIILNQD